MIGRIPSLLLLLLVAAAWPVPAPAQCRLCTAPTTAPEVDSAIPVKLEVQSSLDFDRLVFAGNGSGSALLSADGTRRTSGAILTMGGRAMVGSVTVRGEPGRNVRVSLPPSITLFGTSGGQVRIDSIRSDLASLPRIGSNGVLTFRFGGELHVAGNVDGDFRGDFQVDVDYL